ncbi:MAG: hypothetical protein GC180_00945 [Bacteroidetes bacterium]|nr:hypothetical protein [Bacteroidota bacterium]
MCTLTYIPTETGFVFTSNRDEQSIRAQAAPPEAYDIGGQAVWYPKDGLAGGTWIASSVKRQLCLLNGAFDRHERHPPYRKSRGLVLLDSFRYKNLYDFFHHYLLGEIEPFTLVEVSDEETPCLAELRWDGANKSYREFDSSKGYIWSSATLYTKEQREKREAWFLAFHKNNPHPTQNEILDFHRFSGEGNKRYDLVMEVGNSLQTLSITSIERSEKERSMRYLDLLNDSEYVLREEK